jgi:hypothetical protein
MSPKVCDQIEPRSVCLVSAGKLSCGCGDKLSGAETRGKRDRQQPRDSMMQPPLPRGMTKQARVNQ